MPADGKMSADGRRQVLKNIQQQHEQVIRKEKGKNLSHLEASRQLHRKSLGRLLNGT